MIEITMLSLITIAVLLLWETPIIYPIKLMVILFHEISHGFAAILTGGKVIDLSIELDLSGVCHIEDGNQIAIASAGYIGSFLFGMILFYSSLNRIFSKVFLPVIFGLIIIFLINSSKNEYLILITSGLVLLLLLIIFVLPSLISDIVLKTLGIISCFYIVLDIKQDIFDSTDYYSDAYILAELTGINQMFWGLLWLVIAILGIILLLRLSHRQLTK
ncbi:MAG: M50 family metallopeptidase [Bacteroidota bacterium]